MGKKNYLLSLVVLVVMLAVVMAACSGGNESPNSQQASSGSQDKTTDPDTAPALNQELEKVNLVGYLLGEAPPDGPAVMAELNKRLEEKINATIEVKYIPFADLSTTYPLILSSGDDFDFIYGNHEYVSNASKGGYREITMEDVKEYMPLSYNATTPEQWADTLVNGKIYMIPQTFKELNVGGQFYREDLRKKYNVPEIKTMYDLDVYFKAIKENEPEMMPADGTIDDIMGIMPFGYFDLAGTGIAFFDLDDPTHQIYSIFSPEFQEVLKKNAETMKKFNEEGYIPKNPFAQKTSARDLGAAGRSAIWNNAFENYPQYASDAAGKGWEIGYIPGNLSLKGSASLRPATGNGISFSPNSKNYERALMAIDLIHQDPEFNMLISFGIEGVNYVIEDGKLALGPEIDAANNPYPMYSSGFWSTNRDLWPPLENYTDDYLNMKKQLQDSAASNVLMGFNFNGDNVKSEMANISNVTQQYLWPIKAGVIAGDVDSAIEEYLSKLKTAGAEKVFDEVVKQVEEYLANK